MERDVSFQPGGETDWGWAIPNRPLTTGDSLWTGNRSRAEMHIGGTAIHVAGRTLLSFLNLDDRTVQLQLNSGTIDAGSLELTGQEDLDQNDGTWRTDRTCGPVWIPSRLTRDWAPYREDHWTRVRPWGWTRVDDALCLGSEAAPGRPIVGVTPVRERQASRNSL